MKTWFIASDVLNILSKSFNCSNKKYFKIHFKLLTPSAMLLSTAAAAKLLQLGPTMCDPIDSSPPGYPVPGILQARTLEWVAISFSKAWKWKVKVKSLSRVRLLATPWTAAYQAPPSVGFSIKPASILISKLWTRSIQMLEKCQINPTKVAWINRWTNNEISPSRWVQPKARAGFWVCGILNGRTNE